MLFLTINLDPGYGGGWPHVKEIPNTSLLVSLHHNRQTSANMEVLDISKNEEAKKIYSLGEVFGGNLE